MRPVLRDRPFCSLFFFLAALPLGCSSAGDAPSSSSSAAISVTPTADAIELARTQAYLGSFYADADVRHTFDTVYGEKIDCIDYEAQPAVKELVAKGEQIDDAILPPGVGPEMPKTTAPLPFDGRLDENGSARACPAGTVPAHRPAVDEIRKAGGLDAFRAHVAGIASPSGGAPGEQAQLDCFDDYSGAGPSYDHAAGYEYTNYQGLLTFTSTYNPYVEVLSGEHSVSQLWAITGTCEDDAARRPTTDPCTPSDAVQSLEMGWIVGDNPFNAGGAQLPMLFTFATLDGYLSENCWGMTQGSTCGTNGGFVQVPGANYVPGSYMPYSSSEGLPVEMALQVWNGSAAGHPYWYVYVNGNLIGYYPGSMYAGQMRSSASYLQVGGEVYDSSPGGHHTGTQMGSGFGSGGWERQAYHRGVSTIDTSNAYHPASLSYVNGNTGICGWQASSFYSLETAELPGPVQTKWGSTFGQWGTYFYFGGPQQPAQ